MDSAVVPFSGVLNTFREVRLFPGPEVDAGDLVVEHGDKLSFYSLGRTGKRRRYAEYERREGAWWIKPSKRGAA